MVIKMYDILTSSSESCRKRPRLHMVLRVFRKAVENVYCGVSVRICRVVTLLADKLLALAVCFGNVSTHGASTRSVFRINQPQTNTVFCGQTGQSCQHFAVRPRSHRFSKILASIFFLAVLQIFQVFSYDCSEVFPRQVLCHRTNVIPALTSRSTFRFTTGFFPFYFFAQRFYPKAIMIPATVGYELINPNVNAHCFSGLELFVGKFDPKPRQFLGRVKGSTLKEFCPELREPIIQPDVGFEGNGYSFSRGKTGHLEYIVKGAFSFFNVTDKRTQSYCAMYLRAGGQFPKLFSGTLCGNDCFKGNLEAILTMPVAEAAPRESIEGFRIESTGVFPQVLAKPVQAGTDFVDDSNQSALFRCGYLGKGNLNRSYHLTVFLDSFDSGFSLFPSSALTVEARRKTCDYSNKVFHEVMCSTSKQS